MGDLTDDEIGAHRLEYLEACLAKRWQVPTEDIALLIKEVSRHRAARTTSAERVRAVVREAASDHLGPDAEGWGKVADDIADRVVAQLTAPVAPGLTADDVKQLRHHIAGHRATCSYSCSLIERMLSQVTAPPGHVCPVPYGLGPDDLDVLEWLANSGLVAESGSARAVLDKILAMHRAPEPTIAQRLPEVVTCGAKGCLSSIKKHLLPAGWLLLDGVWRCPRCKVVATTEAS